LVDDWNWGWQAFVIWGALVFIAALTYQLAVKGMSNKAYRIALGLAVTTAFLLFCFSGSILSSALKQVSPISRILASLSLASLGLPSRGYDRAAWRSHWAEWRSLKYSSLSSR
jgi:hypothetical protein